MTSPRRLLVLACSTLFAFGSADAAHAATIESSTSGDWADPATWVGGVAPGPGDDVEIRSGDLVSLSGDTSVATLEVEGTVDLAGFQLSAGADVSLLGDYWGPSALTSVAGGALQVSSKLLVQNTSVSHVAVTTTSLELSGALPGDTEARSSWLDATLTVSSGTATLAGHTLTGLNPVFSDAAVNVSGINDISGQVSFTGWGTLTFAPTALSGPSAPAMLSAGSLLVTGVHQTSLDWSDLSNLADGDRVNLVSVAQGDTEDISTAAGGSTSWLRPVTGELLYATYIGFPRPIADPAPSVSSSSPLPGHALPGDTITCDPGTWTPDGTKAYSWSADGTPINGETTSTFTVTSTELGTDVRCTVAVTSTDAVTGTETSSNGVHVDIAPANIVEPEPKSANSDPAAASVGDVLTCDEGLWSASTPTYAYTWERDGNAISGATARTYATSSADADTEITCSVVATEGLASSAPVTSLSGVTIAGGPVATTAPSATSTRTPSDLATTGDVLTCDPGVWTPDGTKTYAWKRDAVAINDATATTYTVTQADLDTDLTCSVTVTDGGVSGTADSDPVAVVAIPQNSVAPSISGTAAPGKATANSVLSCDPGTWTLTPTYSYTWKRDATVVGDTSTYAVGSLDESSTLTCVVTATANGVPSAAVSSAWVEVIATPSASVLPSISGTPTVGEALSCAPGTWSGAPELTFQWLRGSTPVASGSAVYTVARADRNAQLRCKVTASVLDVEASALSSPVTAQAVAPIEITERPEATITTRSTRVAYTLAPDVTVTGCSLNGAALGTCTSPIVLDGLASKGDHSLVINVRNAYGEDETRTVSFATRGGPSVAITNWPSNDKAARFKRLVLKFEVEAGAMVACTFDGQPMACTATGADLIVPRSGVHVFEVTATDAFGASTTDRRTLEVAEIGDPLPRAVRVVASGTVTIPASTDLRAYKLDLGGLAAATPVGTDEASWGLRIKAPAKKGKYRLQVLDLAAVAVEAVEQEVTAVDHVAGGVTDATAPLTCPAGTPGSFYTWYVDGNLVRTDASNAFPAAAVPSNGLVSCAVNDPVTGLGAPVQVLVVDGVRYATTAFARGTVLASSGKSTIHLEYAVLRSTGTASTAKPKKPRFMTLHTADIKLKQGAKRISFGRQLPTKGFKITIKVRRPKGYSKPLVLSKG